MKFQNHGIDGYSEYNGKSKTLIWTSNLTAVEEEDLFNEATWSIGQLFKYIKIRRLSFLGRGHPETAWF